MAVVDTLSEVLQARDGNVLGKREASGVSRWLVGTLEAVSGDSVGSTYRFLELPAEAVVLQVLVSSDDIGTTTTMDLGIYQNTRNGSAVVDADFFASALSLKDGALSNSDVTGESAVYDALKQSQPLWEALGVSNDAHYSRTYDLVGTLTGAADAAGTITVKVCLAL